MDEKDTSADEMLPIVEEDELREDVASLGEGETDAASLKKALSDEQAKAEGYLANWQRAQADFANFKRRTEQERNEVIMHANATLMLTLLPVLDDLERALDNVSEKLAKYTWVDGIVLIYRKFKAILEGHGLSEIEALDQPFDPNLHEAALYIDGEEGKVIEELQKGYKLNDRVLRHTKVAVGKGSEEKDDTSQEEMWEENNG